MTLRKWQNLVHRKCPNCDERLGRTSGAFVCPQDGCFYISIKKLVEFITDESGPTWQNMSEHERDLVKNSMKEMGIMV